MKFKDGEYGRLLRIKDRYGDKLFVERVGDCLYLSANGSDSVEVPRKKALKLAAAIQKELA